MKIVPGCVFDTRHERDCIAKTTPDEHGNVEMVTWVGRVVMVVPR